MKIEDKRKIINEFLPFIFVDFYRIIKSCMDVINKLIMLDNFSFRYSYDEFCVGLLKESLLNAKDIDLNKVFIIGQSQENFRVFLSTISVSALYRKYEALGYKSYDCETISFLIEHMNSHIK
jgi:hypothetical protein